MSTEGKSKKLSELQVFSGIAIVFVVLIHSLSYYLTNVLNLSAYTDARFLIRLFQNIIYTAVPMFVFIAGYKYALNNIGDDYKEHVVKKIESVLKPFVVISLIFIIKNIVQYPQNYTGIGFMIVSFLKVFIGVNPAYQLWFIPMYLLISITYPFLYKRFKNDKSRIAIIILIVLIQRLLGSKLEFFNIQLFKFIYYYLFYEMGVLFHKYNIKEKLRKYDLIIICFYILATFIVSKIKEPFVHKQIQLYLLSFLSITAFYFISIRVKDNKSLNFLGEESFGIYLFHEPFLLTSIANIFVLSRIYNSMLDIFLIAILSIIVSIAVIKIINNTFLKYIFFNIKKKKTKVNIY